MSASSRCGSAWIVAASLVLGLSVGCNTGVLPGTDEQQQQEGTLGGAKPLSFQGTLGGAPSTEISTRGESGENARRVPLPTARTIVVEGQLVPGAVVSFKSIDGEPLLDAEGNPYPDVTVDEDGTFEMEHLPVGVDFLVCVDTDGDGEVDLQHCVLIPKDPDGETGTLDDVNPNPLTTLALAKLKKLLAERGVDISEVTFSPAILINRIVDAYQNLFEEAGIDDSITLDEIADRIEEQLAELFDTLVPSTVRRGMEMAGGNLALAEADSVEDVVRAVAEVLIHAGFPVADDPGGVDLSFLSIIPHVEEADFDDLDFGPPREDDDGPEVEQFFGPEPDFTIYLKKVVEVDRNWAKVDAEDAVAVRLPIIHERVIAFMARGYLEGATVTLGDLYQVLTSAEEGFGARITYFAPTVDEFGNMVGGLHFETADGQGVVLNEAELFETIDALGVSDDFDPEEIGDDVDPLRDALADFLAGTVAPPLERLFEGIIGPVESYDTVARRIRTMKAHVPFNISGPSQFFVVATADGFSGQEAEPVTVDIVFDDEGHVETVTYNEDGQGKYYLGFAPETPVNGQVEFIVRETGKTLRKDNGEPLWEEMSNAEIFQPVQLPGHAEPVPFLEAFSEQGAFYPGAPALRVPNEGFDPNLPPDPETNPPEWEIFVLMTGFGPDAEPVTVTSNGEGGYTYEPSGAGQFYLAFSDRTESEGKFNLVSQDGRFVREDPSDPASNLVYVGNDDIGSFDLDALREETLFVYGVNAKNEAYEPERDPYYDDINDNDVWDAGEPTFSWRPILFNPEDWRSTDVERYYRRADNDGFVDPADIDWGSDTPRLMDGTELVPRNLKSRMNAWAFGRPNTTINLIAAFADPGFFNGTVTVDENTELNPFSALAFAHLAFERMHNVEAVIDFDGPGPAPAHEELVEAFMWVLPVGDPVTFLARGLAEAAGFVPEEPASPGGAGL